MALEDTSPRLGNREKVNQTKVQRRRREGIKIKTGEEANNQIPESEVFTPTIMYK